MSRRAVFFGVVTAAALVGAACGPCDGVIGCRGAARLGVGGQIVERAGETAAPVSGARVEVVRTGGVELAAPSTSATTDGTGWWQVSVGASAAGEVTADVVVTPPGGDPAYRVSGVRLRASEQRGDGTVLGKWVSRPYISALGVVRDAATGAAVVGARVTAVRSAGIAVEATPATATPMVTSGLGYFLLDLRPLAYGPLTLDFVVERNGVGPVTVRGVTILPDHEWTPVHVRGDLILDVGVPPAPPAPSAAVAARP